MKHIILFLGLIIFLNSPRLAAQTAYGNFINGKDISHQLLKKSGIYKKHDWAKKAAIYTGLAVGPGAFQEDSGSTSTANNLKRILFRPSVNWFISTNDTLSIEDQNMTQTLNGFGSITGLIIVDRLLLTVPVPIAGNATKAGLTDWEGGLTFLAIPTFGVLWKKYRFADPVVPAFDEDDDGRLSFVDDPFRDEEFAASVNQPPHDYPQGFFRYPKSKLVMSYLRTGIELGILTGSRALPIMITAGPVFDVTLGVKHKSKFIENGNREKIKQTGVDKFNAQWYQFGVTGGITLHRFTFYGAYFFNEVFEENLGPEVRSAEFGVYLGIL